MTAQVLTVDAHQYHADELADQPTLSSSIAKLLVEASPAHARAAHPKLNPSYERRTEDKFEFGIAAHQLLLEGESAIEVCVFDNWLTKAAKEQRDQARAYGRIPVLAKDADRLEEFATEVRRQLAESGLNPVPFTDGEPEQTMVWDEDGVLCRARIDWLHTNGDVRDLKTTSRYAPGWDRGPLFDNGCDIQAALYMRGLRKLLGRDPEWTWIVAETKPPYGVMVYKLTAPVRALGDSKLDVALAKWKACLETGRWPGYPATVVDADLPAYVESRWLAQEAREEVLAA
jgi:hypothetical protein